MIKKLSVLAAAALFGASAQAAFIIGSVSVGGGFAPGGLPPVPSVSIVSSLTGADVINNVNVFTGGSGTSDFATVASMLAFDILPPALPTTFYTTDNGYTFTISSFVKSASQALTCNNGLCTDNSTFSVSGIVTKGADLSQFLGSWTANGTCLAGGDGVSCANNVTASYSASLTATGRAVEIPEPGVLALVGLGLAGVALSRRRKT